MEHNMKTITCLALGVIMLSFIVENSDGKITILHEGRVSGAPKRKSRRKTVRRRPSTPANEDSGNSTQDKRPLVVCNHTINVYLFLFQRLLSPWSRLFVISKRRPHDKKKKRFVNLFSFHRNTTDGASPHTGSETMFTSHTKRTRYC